MQSAIRRFSRQEAMDFHRNLQKQAASNNNQVWIPSYLDVFCKPIQLSSKPLRPIKLSELQLDCWHQGRALQGHLITPAFNFRNIAATVLQDEEGNAAKIFVSHVLCSHSSPEEMHRSFPENAQVRIKEPCFVSKNPLVDGNFIWVPNPACFEIVRQNLELPSDAMRLAREEYSRGNFAASVEIYSKLLKLENKDQLVSALAGRAASWFGLRRYEDALNDAEQVLKLDASHIPSLRLKVEALWGMQLYTSAHDFSKQALVGIPELKAVHDKALVYKDQSERGTYDLSSFYIGGLKRHNAPEGAEFVGPVDVRISPGRGRGLFVTAGVRTGDLLIVSNAVARIPVTEDLKERITRGDSSELLAKVIEVCLTSKRTLSQIYSMAEASRSVQVGISGQVKKDKEAPSIDLFRPNCKSFKEEEGMVLDVAKLQNIIDTSTEFGLRDDYSDDFVGFWTLPAFINHSCLPNVCVRKFGKSIFVFAARDMESGQELLRSYVHSLHPYMGRRSKASFICSCQRCILEERLAAKLQGTYEKYSQVLQGMYHRAAEVVSGLEDVLEKETGLTRKEKHWLRAMFPAAYASCFGGFVDKTGLRLPSADEIMEALHETAPGDMITLLMMSSFKQNATRRGLHFLMEECAAAYGRTSPAVSRAILDHLEAGRIGGST